MKIRPILERCLPLFALLTSCASWSGLHFDIDTSSPQKTYRVVVEGRGDPPHFFTTVQQVRVRALRGGRVLFSDGKFYREEVDHLFTAEYPVHEWLNESVLRFGKPDAPGFAKTRLVLRNGTGRHIDVLKTEQGVLDDKLLIFDLSPGESAEVMIALRSDRGTRGGPKLLYTAYSGGTLFSGVVLGWQGSNQTGSALTGGVSE